MRKKININIAEPCNENWKEMTATERGAFCNACERDLYDFTKMTDIELVHFFTKNTSDFCGRYKKSQLNRNITLNTSYNFSRLYKYVASLFLVFGSFNNLKANPKSEIHFIESSDTENHSDSGSIIFEGNVKDNNGEKLPFVNIAAFDKNDSLIASTTTNIDGYYLLSLSKSQESRVFVVKISYIGMKTISFLKTSEFFMHNQIKMQHEFNISEPMILGMIAF